VDLYTKDPGRYEKAYKALKRSVELEKNNSNPAVLVYYFRIAVKMLRSDKITKTELVDAYDVVSSIIDYNLRQGSKASLENAQRNVELTFEPYASCEDLISIYQAKFKAAPGDADILRRIISILDKKSCTDSDLYFDVTVKLNEIEPSPESSYLIGKMFIRRGDQGKAVEYLEKGTKMTDQDDLADCYLLLANARFHLKNYPPARAAALESARLRPDDGRPYLLIGDMYASSAESCGDNKLTRKVAYWAAVDKYVRAKSVDSRLEKEANDKIATYSRYFPPVEDIFFYELAEGQEYTVGCWINETTTVRAVKQ
jgi:tetratricopeptide (TPR) repeat protein